jgi:hypothetical protein
MTNSLPWDPALYDPARQPPLIRPIRNAANQRVGFDPVTQQFVPAAVIGQFASGPWRHSRA